MTTYADLIDTAYIANQLALDRRYVTDRVVKRPDFPAPVLRLTKQMVRWSRADFERWRQEQARRCAA